jgi:glycosyltransferase involved in cell wall biosynthesis
VFWWAFPVVLISRLTSVKIVLIPSGVDVANYPEIRYGALQRLMTRSLVRFALNNADLVLPVSSFIKQEVLKISKPRKMKIIYNGINVRKFKCTVSNEQKESMVLTVGSVNKMNLKYKRFDLFVDCARHLPEVKFIIAGAHLDDTISFLQHNSPSNLFFTGFLSEDDLIRYYGRAKVYAQLSHAEAFGCALVEAMSCECVPVVVKRGSLPEVAGDTGFLAPYDDPQATAKVLRSALSSDKGGKARKRVLKLFSLRRREMELIDALNEMLGKQSHKCSLK